MYSNGLDNYTLYKEIEDLELYALTHLNRRINIWDLSLDDLLNIYANYLGKTQNFKD